MIKIFCRLLLLVLIGSLTGCLHWVRAYQTYLQMDEFDQYFAITVEDDFIVHFNDPILYSDDFISLSKLQPSSVSPLITGQRWRYLFRKADQQMQVIQPEVKFYFDLSFNEEDRLISWTFSPMFLEIAPAKFLDVSLRSLGNAEINKDKRQLKVNSEYFEKISSELPQKSQVLRQLGSPIRIDDEVNEETYIYQFVLDTPEVEEGYEYRALSEIKLTFDKQSEQLIKMWGRFIGMKISIDYRKYQNDSEPQDTISRLKKKIPSIKRTTDRG